MENYTPELGQYFNGQPWNEYGVPGFVEKALESIRAVMETLPQFKKYQYTPFDNAGEQFKNEVFECNAYSWAECQCDGAWDDDWTDDKCTCGHIPQTYNFKYKDFEVSWYKYLGRGMSMNRPITQGEMADILSDCLSSLIRAQEPERSDANTPNQGAEP
jgi:hypothetical protein